VNKLVPDPLNVRIKGSLPDVAATVAYLYTHEKVMELARAIAEEGYLDNEVPIVTKENGSLVVLEGNRRVSALQGLLTPSDVPSHAIQLGGLVTRINSFSTFVPSDIRVMIAPSRQAAQHILASLHTRDAKKSWGLEQQATFYKMQLSTTVTVDDLKRQYPSVADKIPRFITMADMVALVRAAASTNAAAAAFVDTDRFKMTALEYLYKSKPFQAAIALSINTDGTVLPAPADLTDWQKKLLVLVLEDLKSGYFSTRGARSLVSNPAHLAYVQSLVDISNGVKADHNSEPPSETGTDDENSSLPETFETDETSNQPNEDAGTHADEDPTDATDDPQSETDEAIADDINDNDDDNDAGDIDSAVEDGADGDQASGSTRAAKRSVFADRLDFIGLDYQLHSPGLKRRLEELQTISLNTYPNAAMDMIRTFLECSLKQYFRQSTNSIVTSKNVALTDCLNHASKHFASDNRLTKIINNLKMRGPQSQADYLKSAEALNGINHEPDVTFTKQSVNDAWAAVYPLIKVLLAGPTAAP
jgi:hypothetical protein